MIKRFWDTLSSASFAVMLLVCLAVISILGTIIPQKESADVYLKLFGEVGAKIFDFFGLFDLFASPLFIILSILLGCSLFSCSFKRLIMAISGEKGLFLWGSFLAHLSILIIYLGVIYGSMSGFSYNVNIEKGTSYFEKNGGFAVRLNDFNASFDRMGRPLDYSSDLSIIENNKEAARKTIRVNQPLEYKGIKLYQSSYGLNGVLEISKAGGKTERVPIYRGGCAVYSGTGRMFHVQEMLPDVHSFHGTANNVYEPTNAVVYLIATGGQDYQEVGWLMKGKSVSFDGYQIKLSEANEYTGIHIKKDPGIPVVYAGFLLLVLGTTMMIFVKQIKNDKNDE